MKKTTVISKSILMIASLTLLVSINGCYNNNDTGIYGTQEDDDSHYSSILRYLVDENGYALDKVRYRCDSDSVAQTFSDGEFSFDAPESCIFYFEGFDGNYGNGSDSDKIIRIVKYSGEGEENIRYRCDSSDEFSNTNEDGSFEYEEDDICTFEFI